MYLSSRPALIKRTRGCELPGTFNLMRISDFFLEQSRPWEVLAKYHIEQAARPRQYPLGTLLLTEQTLRRAARC
jgi:hypothetical protein